MASKALIVSVSPEPFHINRGYSRAPFERLDGVHTDLIDSAPNDGYTAVWLDDKTDYKRVVHDLKDIEMIPVIIPTSDIIKDIFMNEQMEKKGCFVAASDAPSEQELSAARARRRKYLTELVEEGDRMYGRVGDKGLETIPDMCKRACIELGETRKWVFQPVNQNERTECEGCGESVSRLKNGRFPAICKVCKSPIDRDLAIELGLWTPPKKSKVEKDA
jgi:hypothetical protein